MHATISHNYLHQCNDPVPLVCRTPVSQILFPGWEKMAVWEELLLEDNKEFVPRGNCYLSADTEAVKIETKV